MTASIVILAAGRGDRMQTGANKMLMPICGQPLICHTVRAFTQITEITDYILVVHAEEMDEVKQLTRSISRRIRFIEGGTARRDSALAGIQAAREDIVLIHDGARPFPTQALIRTVLAETEREQAVIPVLPITDLLHYLEPGHAITALPDSNTQLARAQTPQGFSRELILRCLQDAPSDIRDDASAILLAGKRVVTVPGECTNIKVTHPEDLPLAEAIAAYRES